MATTLRPTANVVSIADDSKHRKHIAAHARQSLAHDALSRVTFGAMDDAMAWLGRFQLLPEEQATVAGYDVQTVIIQPSSLSDHRHRVEPLRHLLNSRG